MAPPQTGFVLGPCFLTDFNGRITARLDLHYCQKRGEKQGRSGRSKQTGRGPFLGACATDWLFARPALRPERMVRVPFFVGSTWALLGSGSLFVLVSGVCGRIGVSSAQDSRLELFQFVFFRDEKNAAVRWADGRAASVFATD